jgi:hypothetical protein
VDPEQAAAELYALADAWEASGEPSRAKGNNPRDLTPSAVGEAAAAARIGCAQALRSLADGWLADGIPVDAGTGSTIPV